MIHLEQGHRIVAETVSARFQAEPDKREAVDVRCSDFGTQYYVCVPPERKNIVQVSLWLSCFDEVKDLVGERYFQELYPGMEATPTSGYSLTITTDLDALPDDKGEHQPAPRRARPCPRRAPARARRPRGGASGEVRGEAWGEAREGA